MREFFGGLSAMVTALGEVDLVTVGALRQQENNRSSCNDQENIKGNKAIPWTRSECGTPQVCLAQVLILRPD